MGGLTARSVFGIVAFLRDEGGAVTRNTRRLGFAGLISLIGSILVSPAPAQQGPTCMGVAASIVGTSGDDTIGGTQHRDVIVGRGGSDRIDGRGGDDLICAGSGVDRVQGGPGEDTIRGQRAPDRLRGGDGSDSVNAGRGFFNLVSGDAGNDRLKGTRRGLTLAEFFGAPRGVTVDLARDSAVGEGRDRLVDISAVAGSTHNDVLSGDRRSNFLFGGPGDDTINGRGNAGDLSSPASVDELRFDFLAGDTRLQGGPPGNDTLTGGGGFSVASYEEAPNGIDVDLALGSVQGEGTDTLTGIRAVVGSEFDDVLRGDDSANLFEGRSGVDTIRGRGGRDVLVLFDAVRPRIDLGAGSGTGRYFVFTGEERRRVSFAYTLEGIEDVWGSPSSDVITGDAGANRLFGAVGADRLSGAGGNDLLDGGRGPDALNGGSGDDVCRDGEDVTNCERAASRSAAREASGGRSLIHFYSVSVWPTTPFRRAR